LPPGFISNADQNPSKFSRNIFKNFNIAGSKNQSHIAEYLIWSIPFGCFVPIGMVEYWNIGKMGLGCQPLKSMALGEHCNTE
jgi:hypothetical protein